MRNWDTEQLGHLVSGNFDQGDYDYWREAGLEALEDNDDDVKAAREELKTKLEDEITEGLPEVGEPYASWLSGALSEIDWRQVAELILEGIE